MIDDSTEEVSSSFVGPSSATISSSEGTISSSEGAEASTSRGGWDAWASWGLGSTSWAVDDVASEGGKSSKAPSPVVGILGADAPVSTSWGGGDSKAPAPVDFWASGSGVKPSEEPGGDPEVSLRPSEDLALFPGATAK